MGSSINNVQLLSSPNSPQNSSMFDCSHVVTIGAIPSHIASQLNLCAKTANASLYLGHNSNKKYLGKIFQPPAPASSSLTPTTRRIRRMRSRCGTQTLGPGPTRCPRRWVATSRTYMTMLRRKMQLRRWAPTSRASWRASSRTTTRPSGPPTHTVRQSL